MKIKAPKGYYTSRFKFLEDFKRINNIESMDEEAFLEAHFIKDGVVYNKSYRGLDFKIVKRSRVKIIIIYILSSFIRITDFIIKWTQRDWKLK